MGVNRLKQGADGGCYLGEFFVGEAADVYAKPSLVYRLQAVESYNAWSVESARDEISGIYVNLVAARDAPPARYLASYPVVHVHIAQ